MKQKICLLAFLALHTAVYAQDPSQKPASGPAEVKVVNTDGTTTSKQLNDQGNPIQLATITPEGSVDRRTLLQYDRAGHCLSWQSFNAHGTVDSGQLYTYDETGVLNGMRGLDGSVIYQK